MATNRKTTSSTSLAVAVATAQNKLTRVGCATTLPVRVSLSQSRSKIYLGNSSHQGVGGQMRSTTPTTAQSEREGRRSDLMAMGTVAIQWKQTARLPTTAPNGLERWPRSFKRSSSHLSRVLQQRQRRSSLLLLQQVALTCCSILIALIATTDLYQRAAFVATAANNDNAQITGIKSSPQTNSVTKAYGDPIKWSFGGWAPLDGSAPRNGSAARADPSAQQAVITTPLPMVVSTSTQQTDRRTSSRPSNDAAAAAGNSPTTAALLNNKQQLINSKQVDAMKEEASKIQFASIAHRDQSSSFPLNEQQRGAGSAPAVHLHSGPAYALPLQRPPAQTQQSAQQYSPLAPQPIVREHLLPAANDQQPSYNQQQQQQQQQQHQGLYKRPPYGQPSAQFAPTLHHHHQFAQHAHMLAPKGSQSQAALYRHHQQQLQQHHRQREHLFRNQHHHQHQQQQQQSAPPAHSRRPMPYQGTAQVEFRQPEASMSRSIPRYPGSPLMHKQQYQQQQQQQPQQQQQVTYQVPDLPAVGPYKVIEGEQPILFTNPLNNEQIPMIEMSAGYKNESGASYQFQPAQQLQSTADKASEQSAAGRPEMLYSSALAAIERDNLNYQQALNQVTNYNAEEQQMQQLHNQQQQQERSNNIQDIKQRQQYEQQQQQQQQQQQLNNPSAIKSDNTRPSYLTIPVAVETEGDKVLTADDINEIEKHVINVLPNLKAANKIVKLADAQLTLANLKGASESGQQQQQQQHQQQQVQHPAQLAHQANYEEHRTTLKQLEGDIKQQQQQQQRDYPEQPETQVSLAPSTYGSSATASVSQPTTAKVQQQQQQQLEEQQQQQQQLSGQEYFVAAGPPQELATVDPDQIADYNLIKNDLLNSFRYEPTRANSGAHSSMSQHQTASTPPMPYSSPVSPSGEPNSGSSRPSGGFTVSRYFHQGSSTKPAPLHHHTQSHDAHRPNNLFGRISGGANRLYTSTTKTMMGGRKVSEVMRPLIHTTPVPMTSPLHVPSVEPDKVDAIQLIAGAANDKQPMVVEAHQLVNHTPDGGIDYNSGASLQQLNQRHPMNQTSYSFEPSQQQQLQQQVDQTQQQQQQQQSSQYHQPQTHQQQDYAATQADSQSGDNQGAIIEYVAIPDQAAPGNSKHQQQQVEISNEPQYASNDEQHQLPQRRPQPVDSQEANRAPFMYDYTMSTQHQVSAEQDAQPPTPPTYVMTGSSAHLSQHHQQQQQPSAPQQQQEQQPHLAVWSPSVTSEHQQQQAELSEHVGPMQQIDLPSTAGYNFFGQQDNSQSSVNGQDQQQQQEQEQQTRWRTKAGGSQPNPDAQYDGQIEKTAQEQDVQSQTPQEQQVEDQSSGQQYTNYGSQQQQQSMELTRLPAASNARPQESYSQQQQQIDNNESTLGDSYRQQQQQQYHEQALNPSQNTDQQQQQQGDGYLSTNSYVAGAQMNHQTPSYGSQEQSQQSQHDHYNQQSKLPSTASYMKLDPNRQQNHLVQHQAQHQAQLAELMATEQPYQTTTPMTLTTLAAMEQSSSPQQEQIQQEISTANGNSNNNNNGYMVEQVQARPSVQSAPDSMIINESPMQVPILDQQSLIPDPNQDAQEEMSSDDGGKQRQKSAGVYQVYQAYYAPKDHKPLPGYVRLTLEEFNELFRDAEIQYVDRNLNGLANQNSLNNAAGQMLDSVNGYEQSSSNDPMKASGSEIQSIVVDRRSITEKSTNATDAPANQPNSSGKAQLKLGRAVRKIISIRNSRQLAKQARAGLKRNPQQQQVVESSTTLVPKTDLTKLQTVISAVRTEIKQSKPKQQSNKKKVELPAKKPNTQEKSKVLTDNSNVELTTEQNFDVHKLT